MPFLQNNQVMATEHGQLLEDLQEFDSVYGEYTKLLKQHVFQDWPLDL